jgi:hypothetical protein
MSPEFIDQDGDTTAIGRRKRTAVPPGDFDYFMQGTGQSVGVVEQFLTLGPSLVIRDPVGQPAQVTQAQIKS